MYNPFKKVPLPLGDPGPTWFLWAPRVHTPSGILIGLASLAQLSLVTNRCTHRYATSVTTGHIIYEDELYACDVA